MKNIYFLIFALLLFTLSLTKASIIDVDKTVNIKTLEEEKMNKLTFHAKKNTLWLESSKKLSTNKDSDTVEISLSGELYNNPKKIDAVNKNKVNRSTLEGIVASVFSANKSGDLKWIINNFVDEDKDLIRELFKDKKLLNDSKIDAQKVEAEYLTGYATYRDYTILFVEQYYDEGKKVTEPLACTKTKDGWKITNSLNNDETFDVIFAALASGEVTDKNKKEEKTKL